MYYEYKWPNCEHAKKGKETQFYVQLVYKPHLRLWILLFGPFGSFGPPGQYLMQNSSILYHIFHGVLSYFNEEIKIRAFVRKTS